MQGLKVVLILALLSVAALLAMLVADGWLDEALLLVAGSPLGFGGYRAWRLRRRR